MKDVHIPYNQVNIPHNSTLCAAQQRVAWHLAASNPQKYGQLPYKYLQLHWEDKCDCAKRCMYATWCEEPAFAKTANYGLYWQCKYHHLQTVSNDILNHAKQINLSEELIRNIDKIRRAYDHSFWKPRCEDCGHQIAMPAVNLPRGYPCKERGYHGNAVYISKEEAWR
jgi:hypothetical protein